MVIQRRSLMNSKRTLSLLVLAGSAVLSGAEEPDLRVGIFTDTHIRKTEESCQLSRQAFELFKRHKVDMVVHLGDLADRHYPEGYKIYRRYFDEVFGDQKPKEIYIYANHDRVDIKTEAGFDADMVKFKNALNIQNEVCDKFVLKGYPFLVYPDFPGYPLDERMTADVREMIGKYPGKPVFVLDHVSPYDTTEGSRVWGHHPRRTVFDQFPQVIHFSGHTHNSLRNELCIWQGNFTAVNAGCLATWGRGKKSDEVLVMEVFPDKILLHRYSVTDGREIRPENPWRIPWPFDPENAPYRLANRKAHSPALEFPIGSKITVHAKGDPFEEVDFSFPDAEHPEGCYRYLIRLEKKMPSGGFEAVTEMDDFGPFYLKEARPPEEIKVRFSAAVFDPHAEYRITVIPQNFYGTVGKPLQQTFRTGTPERGKVVFESEKPEESCVYMTELTDGTVLKPQDGIFNYPGGNTRLIFPNEVWAGPKGTRFRFAIRMALDQPLDSTWTLVLRSTATGRNANIRVVTPSGKTESFIFSLDLDKKTDDDSYFLLLREGKPGKVAFRYVRVEKL